MNLLQVGNLLFIFVPISWHEYENHLGFVESQQELETRLEFGFYPDVIVYDQNKERLILELADRYFVQRHFDVQQYQKTRSFT